MRPFRFKRSRFRRSFSWQEGIIVLVIIAILGLIAAGAYREYSDPCLKWHETGTQTCFDLDEDGFMQTCIDDKICVLRTSDRLDR